MFAQSSKATLNDKAELYFNDHEFSSLMLQENYLGTNPILAHSYNGRQKSKQILDLVDQAAESISDGDLVDSMIHGPQQHWSLMPTHAIFSFVRPASFVHGSTAGHRVQFTSWLGQHSKQGEKSLTDCRFVHVLIRMQANSVATSKRSKVTCAFGLQATATRSVSNIYPYYGNN